ncbi:tRNA (N6-threonylcarbamoyladenosine(37)-N6)-methyltransferase TrmO [Microbulbifer spongiae]|uniref:tRNA (N6-threonylcarbamoyladenosine(37)-N6)-methyltransferase TrmO n=1 Tax=Microbulbifer spongiae TaxID=2944933 RepID=A0ABY9EDF6_9GAMM|nr:tRNA (N6-threonylcarbamoyladenosine(37)-N6)-methyltransferase TrmO [Microbulbifer sp. MI-G]WKD50167.1 tRNA (N6-threonylcarbamoyladenosine(37)-N6)-methyltransferase TrmO [Microbulbifer sp. MI-G]
MKANIPGTIALHPIGTIHTDFNALAQCPRSGRFNTNHSVIEVDAQYLEGLYKIESATHLFILYWFDQSDRTQLQRCGRNGKDVRGVFASRSPNRPNPIALSPVKLIRIEGTRLTVSGLDCLDGTKVVDIKPYIPADDRIEEAKIGWDYPGTEGDNVENSQHPSSNPDKCQCHSAAEH